MNSVEIIHAPREIGYKRGTAEQRSISDGSKLIEQTLLNISLWEGFKGKLS